MASTQLTRSVSSTGSITKATLSVWLKRQNLGSEGFVIYHLENGNNNCRVRFSSADKLEVEGLQGGSASYTVRTTRLFRDPNAWFHLLVRYDSTDGTAGDRIKIYINGVQETSLENVNNPSSSVNMSFNENGSTVYIGGQNGSNYFAGLMSHFYWIDGTCYTPSTFGETDSTTGEWKIKTNPSLTMGTNGFTILKDGATVTDQSANSNNFSASGNLKACIDNPSNNMANLNCLDNHKMNTDSMGDYLTGKSLNNKFITTSANNLRVYARSSIGVTAGKYYWEVKQTNSAFLLGICNESYFHTADDYAHWDDTRYHALSFQEHGANGTADLAARSGISQWSSGVNIAGNTNVWGFALDMDNKAFYAAINGTWVNSGNPASGSTKTGDLVTQIESAYTTNFFDGSHIFPFAADVGASSNTTLLFNFGNGFFDTTDVSSVQNPSSGDTAAKFEYTPPTGFQPLTTKGINA